MILLKYAGLLPNDYKGSMKGLKLSKKDMNTLLIRTKEFVVCGYQLSASEAIELSEAERVALYHTRDEFLRECIALSGLANSGDEDARKEVFKAKWKRPESESEQICQYLALAGALS